MSSSYRAELDRWLSSLDVKAETVLDIGGSQLPIKGRTRSWDVADYKIADLPDPHVDSPKPDIVLDLNIENDVFDTFEVIFCLEVFEYVWNPALALETIADLLEENGKAYVSFPSFYPMHQPIKADSLRYMPAGIFHLATYAQLKIVDNFVRRPETNMLSAAWAAERMRPAKHEDHQFTGFIVEFQK